VIARAPARRVPPSAVDEDLLDRGEASLDLLDRAEP
jgi:hypothetical protein